MAYLDLDNMFAAPVASRPAAAPSTTMAGFSALEWSVIALARRDTLRSLTQPGRLSRAMGSLFGLGTTSSLADPRLEALRRLAVYVWQRGFALPMAEIERFRSAGFTPAQVETLVVSVTGIRIGAEQRSIAA
ncbi:hypothetical protein ASG67_02070 [Sphingomonas sp. Leaf339]|uniref:hypothetical protein n=1 Tax=Sphingomonas sp. Leaf339 TaxID=1736343 RepID=UPI0006F4BD1B|nr:hypothetical protein [Sphingomonas sp. Leaf339]KQU61962.1 hypothetical protein ASG67_02070 [Sphingomonas sp. Leaf339]